MNNSKIKTYKNPERNKPERHQAYTPQYRELGIEPEEYMGNKSIPKPPPNISRAPRPIITQPYAEAVQSPIGRGPVPNVGNNMEHTWSSIDGDIIDDISEQINPSAQMIDNNDYVSSAAYGNDSEAQFLPPSKIETTQQEQLVQELFSVIKELEANTYLLLVNNSAICSGPLLEIEEQVRALVFGEHELCNGHPVSPDEISVVQKIGIKVGVFLQ